MVIHMDAFLYRKHPFYCRAISPVELAERAKQKTTRYAGARRLLYKKYPPNV